MIKNIINKKKEWKNEKNIIRKWKWNIKIKV